MKQKIKMLALLCVFTIIFGSTQFVVASSIKQEKSSDSEILSIIKGFSKENDSIEIDKIIDLYGYDDSITAKCYLLSPQGYAVFDNSNMLVEASFDDGKVFHSVKSFSNEKLYYAGPFNFYVNDSNNFQNIVNEEKASQSVFKSLNVDYYEKSQKTDSRKVESNSIQPYGVKVYYTLPGKMRNFSYNPNGICGATVAAMALMYYRDNIDNYVVPSWHDTTTGESLIKLIAQQIHGSLDNPVGATIANVVSGCNYYFRWRGIANSYSALSGYISNKSTAFTNMKNIIQSNRPIVLLINSNPTYGDHYITVYEVFQDVGYVDAYYVNAMDGWGSTTTVSLNYATGYVYFNK